MFLRWRTSLNPTKAVAVSKNLRYVIEAVRAEGDSPWFSANHDESALAMDGEIEVHYIKPEKPQVPEGKEGAVKLGAEPGSKKNGLGEDRGAAHQALLPAGSAYQFRSAKPGVLLIQGILGDCTLERWADICQK